jgi:predicted ferric reductase
MKGDWTSQFAKIAGCDFSSSDLNSNNIRISSSVLSMPFIMVDGGYGAASQDVFKYEAAVLIGAGIGVTPFASILKTVWHRFKSNQDFLPRKVYFYWICRDKQAFEWFQLELSALESENIQHFLHIRIVSYHYRYFPYSAFDTE